MTVHLTPSQIDQMLREARAAAPDECCGILVGRRDNQRLIVTTLEPAPNVWEGERHTRFLLDPRTHLRVQRTSRDAGLDIVGFYHSHPHSAPVPSQFDREMAWPDHAYVILTLLDQEPTIRAWRLNETDQQFIEDVLLIDPA